jgi:hypothetical protein
LNMELLQFYYSCSSDSGVNAAAMKPEGPRLIFSAFSAPAPALYSGTHRPSKGPSEKSARENCVPARTLAVKAMAHSS